MRKLIYLFVFIFSHSLMAQQADFANLDQSVKQISSNSHRNVAELSNILASKCTNDIEKARAIYVWIALNINYDYKGFKTGNVPEQNANQAYYTKKAVCQGYSELFYALCKYQKIECQVITGYSKGYGYKPNKKFSTTDHAWNAIKLNNKWQLLDATWASGYVNEKDQYVTSFSAENFLVEPKKFLLKHLPADPMWQLLPEAISVQTFEKDSNFIKMTLQKITNKTNYIDSLKYFSTLDSVDKIINSSLRIIRYNPENGEAWYRMGWFYFQSAWKNMAKLNDPTIQRNKALARPLAMAAIDYQKQALKYLKEAEKNDPFYAEDIKQKKIVIAKNMESLQQMLK